MKNVVFATPSFNFSFTLEFLRAWTKTQWLLYQKGWGCIAVYQGGDHFPDKVRSKLASYFLRDWPDATDCFFLDDDVAWPAEKVLEFLERPEDIVAGIYPKKSPVTDFPVELEMDSDTGDFIEQSGLLKALSVPGGFVRVRRHVLEKMAANSPRFKEIGPDGKMVEFWGIFLDGIDQQSGWFCGEDYNFCRLARALGFSIWVDPNIEFVHVGRKAWIDSLGNHMDAYRAKAMSVTAERKRNEVLQAMPPTKAAGEALADNIGRLLKDAAE